MGFFRAWYILSYTVSIGGLESNLKLQENTADVIAIGMIKNDENKLISQPE